MKFFLVLLFLFVSNSSHADYCSEKKQQYINLYSASVKKLNYLNAATTPSDDSELVVFINQALNRALSYGWSQRLVKYRNEVNDAVPATLQQNSAYLNDMQKKYHLDYLARELDYRSLSNTDVWNSPLGTYFREIISDFYNLTFGQSSSIKNDEFFRKAAPYQTTISFSLLDNADASLKVDGLYQVQTQSDGSMKFSCLSLDKEFIPGSTTQEQYVQQELAKNFPECL